MINPRDEFFHNEGKKEGKLEIAKKLLHKGTKIEEIINLTGLTKTEILKND